jgi:hypothetical protein
MSDLHAAPLEDEPRTPMWLPALGAALFVGVALWWAVTPAATPVAVPEPVASASAPVASAAPAESVAVVAPTPPPSAPVPGAVPTFGGRPLLGAPPGGPAPDPRLRRLGAQLRLKAAGGKP